MTLVHIFTLMALSLAIEIGFVYVIGVSLARGAKGRPLPYTVRWVAWAGTFINALVFFVIAAVAVMHLILVGVK